MKLGWFYVGFAGLLFAQPKLTITSPADGTVVQPGQSLTVTVAASPAGVFQEVVIIAGDPIGFSQPLTAAPYKFTIKIPERIDPGRYLLTADGFTAPGNGTSDSITVVVEPAAMPVSIQVQPSILNLNLGQNGYLRAIGKFSDGATQQLGKSTLLSYVSDKPSVVTVKAEGIVTAVAAGSATVTATYKGLTFPISVTVRQPVMIAPRSAELHALHKQQFVAQTTAVPAPSIAWSVSPAGVGTIDGTGLYSAPAAVPVQRNIQISARNTADPTQLATANVTLFPPLSLTITPQSVSLTESQTQHFIATITNSTSLGAFWSISPSTAGSMASTGIYTAPTSIRLQQVVTVTATSWEDPAKSATATITLVPSNKP